MRIHALKEICFIPYVIRKEQTVRLLKPDIGKLVPIQLQIIDDVFENCSISGKYLKRAFDILR